MGKLQDKTALITGASSGIGKEVARSFADEGAGVAVNYPDDSQAENARAVVAEVEKRGRRAVAIRADVSKTDENAAMVDQLIETFGHIDILVNNAGIGRTAMVEDMSVEMWDEMIAVNLRSVFLATHKVLPLMYAQGSTPPPSLPIRARRAWPITPPAKPPFSRLRARYRWKLATAG